MLRTYAVRVLAVVFVILTLALIVGPLIGQPVLLSFVTSESMEPTIDTGEAFVTIPGIVAGDVEVGDVVVFQAEEIQDGRLTTHRVVEETDGGYITQGDNNPFTDQGNGEPPVTEEQIVGVAWQPSGDVMTVPYVGAAVLGTRSVVTGVYNGVASTLGFEGSTGPQGPMLVVAALLILVAVGDSFREGSSRDWTRSRDDDEIDVRYVAILLVLIVVVPANAAMLLPDTTQEVSMREAAAEGNADPGEEIEVELSASNDGFVTMLFVLNPPSDVRLDNRQLEIPGGASTATTMYATVPPPGEERIVEVSQHRYIVLLPPSLLMTLHELHPIVTLGAINGMLVFGVLTLVIGLAGARGRRARDT
jgi:signal peptidase